MSSPAPALSRLLGRDAAGVRAIPSVCTAHPDVLRITLEHGKAHKTPVLIEATCNQVNQDGGYTGLDPAGFRELIVGMAERLGLPAGQLTLGGDHLGPNPWKALPAEAAMAKADTMVDAYVRAGFRKIHLDTSMGCRGEPPALADETVAARAARLALIAERAAAEAGIQPPVYVIGTEVPPPGGAVERLPHLEVTQSNAVLATLSAHRRAFADLEIEAALDRVIGIVVQPGVEFGDDAVAVYRPEAARPLVSALAGTPGLTYEAHSTDYQPAEMLQALARDGFAILKVGPALTFAWREALYGLDQIHAVLSGREPSLMTTLEAAMLRKPADWAPYYGGDEGQQRVKRHFSFSDRIRYYWPVPEASSAVAELLVNLGDRPIPPTLVSQFLGARSKDRRAGEPTTAQVLIDAHVGAELERYRTACLPD